MKKIRLEYEAAKEQIDLFTYGLLYLTDGIRLEKNPAVSKIDWNKCYEARFFSEDKELHIFERNGENQAISDVLRICPDITVLQLLLQRLHFRHCPAYHCSIRRRSYLL